MKFFQNLALGLALTGVMASCDKSDVPPGGERPGPGTSTETTIKSIGTHMGVISVDGLTHTITVEGGDTQNKFFTRYSYDEKDLSSAGTKVNITFTNSGLKSVTPTIEGGFLGAFEDWRNIQMHVKNTSNDITASKKDGGMNANEIVNTSALNTPIFKNFKNQEQVIQTWSDITKGRQFKEVTGDEFKLKVNGNDWVLRK